MAWMNITTTLCRQFCDCVGFVLMNKTSESYAQKTQKKWKARSVSTFFLSAYMIDSHSVVHFALFGAWLEPRMNVFLKCFYFNKQHLKKKKKIKLHGKKRWLN